MTDLTRRDALMLTAVVAATTASVKVAEADGPVTLPDDNTLLTVPSGTVANSSIPISLKIPATTFAAAPGSPVPSKVQIALTITEVSSAKDLPVLTATLTGMALPSLGKDLASTPAITLMTRLKMGIDKSAANQTPQTNVSAIVTMSYAGGPKTVKASQKVTIKNEDCALSDVSVLRFSLQPPAVQPKSTVMVRGIAPPAPTVTKTVDSDKSAPRAGNAGPPPAGPPPAAPPPAAPPAAQAPAQKTVQVPTHKLTKVLCTMDSDSKGDQAFLTLDNVDDRYLSAEMFVGSSIFASDNQLIRMEWTYVPNNPDQKPPPDGFTLKATGLAVVTSS